MLVVVDVLAEPELAKVAAPDLLADAEVGPDHEHAGSAGAGLAGAGAVHVAASRRGGRPRGRVSRRLGRRLLLGVALLHATRLGTGTKVSGRGDAEVRHFVERRVTGRQLAAAAGAGGRRRAPAHREPRRRRTAGDGRRRQAARGEQGRLEARTPLKQSTGGRQTHTKLLNTMQAGYCQRRQRHISVTSVTVTGGVTGNRSRTAARPRRSGNARARVNWDTATGYPQSTAKTSLSPTGRTLTRRGD